MGGSTISESTVQRCGVPARGSDVKDDAKIYQEHRFELVRFATALVGPDDAQDLVSAVVGRVLGRRGGLSGLRAPLPYLMKSVLNEARSQHRRARIVTMVPLESAAGTVGHRQKHRPSRIGGSTASSPTRRDVLGLLGAAHTDRGRPPHGLPPGVGSPLSPPRPPQAQGGSRWMI